jgi:hypothetical protein
MTIAANETPAATGGVNGRAKRNANDPGIALETVLVTPQMAQKWLDECPFEYQRALVNSHVERLALAMLAGEFEISPIKFYVWQGHEKLVDGQHRLTAIVQSQKIVPLIVIRQEARSWDQVLRAWGRIDQVLTRKQTDGLYAARVHEACGLGVEQMNRLVPALKLLMSGFIGNRNTPPSRSVDVVGRGALQWRSEARDFFAATEESSAAFRAKLVKAPVLAVGLITFRYQQARASEFWMRAAGRDRIEANTGEWWVSEVLANFDLKDTHDIARRMACCWNAYYRGKKLSKTQVRDVRIPISILGTPYTYERVIREVF